MSAVNDPAGTSDPRSDDVPDPEHATSGSGPAWGSLVRKMAIYTLARLVLFVAIMLLIVGLSQLIDLDVPILVAGIIALIISLPLSMVLFTRLRNEVNEGIADVDRQRREQKEDLHRRMAGEA